MQPQEYWHPDSASTEPVAPPAEVPAPAAETPPVPTPVSPDDDHPMMQSITWEASEYIHHQKDILWFVGLALVGFFLIALSLFVFQAITFTILLVVMLGAVVFMAVRPPRIMHYRLTPNGVTINDKTYKFTEFRAFGIVADEAMFYVTLLPLKRFMPSIDMYFPQEHGEQIVDLIGGRIPMENVELDIVDRLTRRLRF